MRGLSSIQVVSGPEVIGCAITETEGRRVLVVSWRETGTRIGFEFRHPHIPPRTNQQCCSTRAGDISCPSARRYWSSHNWDNKHLLQVLRVLSTKTRFVALLKAAARKPRFQQETEGFRWASTDSRQPKPKEESNQDCLRSLLSTIRFVPLSRRTWTDAVSPKSRYLHRGGQVPFIVRLQRDSTSLTGIVVIGRSTTIVCILFFRRIQNKNSVMVAEPRGLYDDGSMLHR